MIFSLRISISDEPDRDFLLESGDRDLDVDLDARSDLRGFSFLRRGDLDLLDLELDLVLDLELDLELDLDGLLRNFCGFSLRSDDKDLESDVELDRDLFFFGLDFLLRTGDLDFDFDNPSLLVCDLEFFLFFLLGIIFLLDLELESDFDESDELEEDDDDTLDNLDFKPDLVFFFFFEHNFLFLLL